MLRYQCDRCNEEFDNQYGTEFRLHADGTFGNCRSERFHMCRECASELMGIFGQPDREALLAKLYVKGKD